MADQPVAHHLTSCRLAELTRLARGPTAPGRTYHERFNHPVFGPGLPAPASAPRGRPGRATTIVVDVPLFTDRDGNAGASLELESGSTKLYLGDQLVGETPVRRFRRTSPTCRRHGNYRLTTEAVHPARFDPTTSVSAEWTFRSSHVDGEDGRWT